MHVTLLLCKSEDMITCPYLNASLTFKPTSPLTNSIN